MKLESLQENVELIRNICIIGHIDHGKTTLTDSLLSSNGIISQKLAGQLRYLDSRKDEQERGITMEASGISLFFTRITATERLEYLINLIDSPGHVDFSCEVSSASRLCDGALLLVDAVEGVCAQTYTVLRQAFNEKVKPILVLNKIDRLITEWKQTPEEAFIHLSQILEQVNAILGTYQAEELMNNDHAATSDSEEDFFFNPEKGNVIFASAIDGWAFRTTQFAQFYASKLNVDPETLNKFMWGKYYLDPKTKRVVGPKRLKGRPLKPLFVQFALENVWSVYDTVLNSNDPTKIEKIVSSLGVKIAPRELKSKETRPLLQSIMTQWLPLTGAVLLSVVQKLPNPKQAQAYKMKDLLETANPAFKLEPKLKEAVLSCDSSDDVPIVAFLSKIFSVSSSELPIPAQELSSTVVAAQEARKLAILRSKARAAAREAGGSDVAALDLDTHAMSLEDIADTEVFIGFSRIFSGCIKVGQTIKVLGPKYDVEDPSTHKYVTEMKVSRLFLLMGKELKELGKVPAGNVFGILITNDEILKSATLSSSVKCPNFSGVKMDAPPILRVALEPSDPTQLAQLLAGLKLLDRSDPAVKVELEATGENVIVCAGELHLERCLKDLRERYARIGIEASEPLVPYRETISELPSIQASEKKVPLDSLGRILKTTPSLVIQIRVIPLPAKFKTFLMNTRIETSEEYIKKMREVWNDIAQENEFHSEIGVDWATLLDKIVSFGPNSVGPNLLINNIGNATMSAFHQPDENTGFEYESSIISAFQLAVASGPLCAEPVVGIALLLEKFEILGYNSEQTFLPGQILSAFKETFKQGFLEWSPRLMLAMYTCDLQTDPQYLGKVDAVLSRRRGKILSEDIKDGSTIFTLGASLSVVESFGFVDELRKKTSGVASPQLVFAGFEVLDLDPFWVPTTEEELEDLGAIADRQNLAKFYMEKVRLRKGLAIEKKLVEYADKQRNLKNK